MLPTRAYAPNIPRLSPGGPITRPPTDQRPALVIAAPAAEADLFAAANFTRYPAHSTSEALRLIETARPRVVAIDWDAADIDGPQLCSAAHKFPHTGVLVTMAQPDAAPLALKAGCHAILLKPFAPNLVAARVGRLSREVAAGTVVTRTSLQPGLNRVWPETQCPTCQASGPTSFEFYSYRRMWYACLGCDAVWLGPRQE